MRTATSLVGPTGGYERIDEDLCVRLKDRRFRFGHAAFPSVFLFLCVH